MSFAATKPEMTREAFFDWAEAQNERYEFDGFRPVAMSGGNLNHDRIGRDLRAALHARLRRGGCEVFGPDAGVATVGDTVRYPDAVVTCDKAPGTSRLVPNPVVVCEVLSPTSGRVDRVIKLLEYRAVPTLRRYMIFESASIGVQIFTRTAGGEDWTADASSDEGDLSIPELGVTLPLSEIYAGVEFAPEH